MIHTTRIFIYQHPTVFSRYATKKGWNYEKAKILSSALEQSGTGCFYTTSTFAKTADLPSKISEAFPTVYKAEQVEEEWYDWWKRSGYFGTSFKPTAQQKVFSMVLPPPNVTGTLHLGHALTTAIQDILVRWHRMKGN